MTDPAPFQGKRDTLTTALTRAVRNASIKSIPEAIAAVVEGYIAASPAHARMAVDAFRERYPDERDVLTGIEDVLVENQRLYKAWIAMHRSRMKEERQEREAWERQQRLAQERRLELKAAFNDLVATPAEERTGDLYGARLHRLGVAIGI